jgi:uncharacterized protein YjiS (DUF1127 family)
MAQATTVSASVLYVRAIWLGVGRGVTHAARAVQMAQMISVLGQMTDQELNWIGITRQEIPSFVKKLVCEQD